MKHCEINLSKEYSIPGNARLVCYVQTRNADMAAFNANLDAMLVVPGGGYHFNSEREAEPIALDFLSRRYNAFVLYYDVGAEDFYPLQLTQLACAVDYIKKHADELSINKDRVFASGYSAGGHLVGCLANFWSDLPKDYLKDTVIDAQVAGVVMSYPVIFPSSHVNSFKHLLGEDYASHPDIEKLSLQNSVNEKNPPCFIWATRTDPVVDVMATVQYSTEYIKRGLVVEAHIFPYGCHGGATCDERTCKDTSGISDASCWMDMADRFIKSLDNRR